MNLENWVSDLDLQGLVQGALLSDQASHGQKLPMLTMKKLNLHDFSAPLAATADRNSPDAVQLEEGTGKGTTSNAF